MDEIESGVLEVSESELSVPEEISMTGGTRPSKENAWVKTVSDMQVTKPIMPSYLYLSGHRTVEISVG